MLNPKKTAKKKTVVVKRKHAAPAATRAGASPKKSSAAGDGRPAAGHKPGKTHAGTARAAKTARAGAQRARKPERPRGGGAGKDLQRKPLLRKPSPRPPVDIGIGAVDIAPPKNAPRTLGFAAAEAALEKKAVDVVLLDVRGISGLCDEMVVASANSVTHLGAVCDGIEELLRKQGERVLRTDGRHGAEPDWVLLDYGNLMVHVFRPEARQRTRLEEYYTAGRLVAKWKND